MKFSSKSRRPVKTDAKKAKDIYKAKGSMLNGDYHCQLLQKCDKTKYSDYQGQLQETSCPLLMSKHSLIMHPLMKRDIHVFLALGPDYQDPTTFLESSSS